MSSIRPPNTIQYSHTASVCRTSLVQSWSGSFQETVGWMDDEFECYCA